MNYRGLIAPFIDFRRAFITTDSSIRKDINTLNESITFFEHGDFSAPNEEYFSALEAHLLNSLKQSTTKNRISLTRKFFTWTQKGDAHMQEYLQITNPEQSDGLTESIEASNEEAPKTDFTEEHEGTLTDRGAVSTEPENPPSQSTVDADTTQPIPPHEQQEGAGLDGDKKSSSSKSSQQIKITVYPENEALKKDIEDLAALEGLPVSKFILTLIQQEVNNRREDLSVLRRLRTKRA